MVMDLTKTLLPCPFCGCQTPAFQSGISQYVNCPACYAEGPWNDDSEEEAITAWNTRVVDHLQATSLVDEPINATDAAFMAGEAIYQRDGVSPFLREVMQLNRDNNAKPVDDRGGAVCEQQAVEAVARAIMIARDDGGCIVKDWQKDAKDNVHVAQALRQAHAAIAAMPSLAAKDAEIARLRDALTHYAKDYDYERKCSQWDGGAIARQALGDEA